MVKKGKRVALEVSPSSIAYPVIASGENSKARFRFQSLAQDYEELLKESEAKKKRLQKLQKKKLKLLAEVKFLRKKHKSFYENPSQETLYRLKKQNHRIPSPSTHATQSSPNPDNYGEPIFQEWMQKSSHSQKPAFAPVLDLNKSSFPNAEDMQEFQVEWEAPKVEKPKRISLEGDTVVDDLNVPAWRESSNDSSRLGKRKITWQDQVALRV